MSVFNGLVQILQRSFFSLFVQTGDDEDDDDHDHRTCTESQRDEHFFAMHLGNLEALEEESKGEEAKL